MSFDATTWVWSPKGPKVVLLFKRKTVIYGKKEYGIMTADERYLLLFKWKWFKLWLMCCSTIICEHIFFLKPFWWNYSFSMNKSNVSICMYARTYIVHVCLTVYLVIYLFNLTTIQVKKKIFGLISQTALWLSQD